jgi:hypothetical protein
MSNSYLANVDFEITKSYSVQNRRDETGAVATYILLRPGIATHMQMRHGDSYDNTAELVFKIDRTILSGLTSSISSSMLAPTVTGSF